MLGERKKLKRWGPVLCSILELSFLVSCKHSSQIQPEAQRRVADQPPKRSVKARKPIGTPSIAVNPFDRYLADTKSNWPEHALVRFASECNLDLDAVSPKFAQRPNTEWNIVRDLSHAKEDLETDFYGTLAVWPDGNRILSEEWGMELETGDYYRIFYCFLDRKVTAIESVSWRVEPNEDPSKESGWGFVKSWRQDANGSLHALSKGFVDLRESAIPEPAMDAETKTDLESIGPGARDWNELKYPDKML
jgi:hypothetical protein